MDRVWTSRHEMYGYDGSIGCFKKLCVFRLIPGGLLVKMHYACVKGILAEARGRRERMASTIVENRAIRLSIDTLIQKMEAEHAIVSSLISQVEKQLANDPDYLASLVNPAKIAENKQDDVGGVNAHVYEDLGPEAKQPKVSVSPVENHFSGGNKSVSTDTGEVKSSVGGPIAAPMGKKTRIDLSEEDKLHLLVVIDECPRCILANVPRVDKEKAWTLVEAKFNKKSVKKLQAADLKRQVRYLKDMARAFEKALLKKIPYVGNETVGRKAYEVLREAMYDEDEGCESEADTSLQIA